ncbi:TIGR04283 family arsenosugar biosynthesis glycosyltransferase [Ulvibacter antarcticus]|uniref:RSAM/selenodomain-associated transferase 2 n=1 Tax=Ulvibacter antarcticus TaxID=442714 RepID=A0A3L9ZIB9_9FLAO|nr:TIGR04283 family arsenosugar biosynthesis glycosyltransferase [Ulvibacter antarcticus]RMA66462.1 rSAM/selenodomain-associated transferase 2 [Ulvibacter antarcticus]
MISIVIPVLNEAANIIKLLDHLSESVSERDDIEIIVVDGGSSDQTPLLVSRFSETSKLAIQLLTSEKGRAKQLNVGATKAKGSILYFLHSDSFPPQNFDTYIKDEVEKGNLAGCFKMKFNSNHWWLRLAGWFTKFSWRACRGGDQSQFITKELFNEIGGYDESFIIYEDNILINELYTRNQYTVIQHCLTTSARLYEEKGVWNIQYHFLIIYVKKWLGADAEELYAYYCNHVRTKKISGQPSPSEALINK